MGSEKSSDFCKVTQQAGAELGRKASRAKHEVYTLGGCSRIGPSTAAPSILVLWVRPESDGRPPRAQACCSQKGPSPSRTDGETEAQNGHVTCSTDSQTAGVRAKFEALMSEGASAAGRALQG